MDLRKRSFHQEGGSEEGKSFLSPRQGLRGPREYGTWASMEFPSFLNGTVHMDFPRLDTWGRQSPAHGVGSRAA